MLAHIQSFFSSSLKRGRCLFSLSCLFAIWKWLPSSYTWRLSFQENITFLSEHSSFQKECHGTMTSETTRTCSWIAWCQLWWSQFTQEGEKNARPHQPSFFFSAPFSTWGKKKKKPENLKTSSNFPGSRGTVFDTLAYCVPPLPGKVIKLLFSTPKLCHCISIQHWRTFGNNPPASPYPPLEGGRRWPRSLPGPGILESLPLRPPSFPAPLPCVSSEQSFLSGLSVWSALPFISLWRCPRPAMWQSLFSCVQFNSIGKCSCRQACYSVTSLEICGQEGVEEAETKGHRKTAEKNEGNQWEYRWWWLGILQRDSNIKEIEPWKSVL